MGENRKEEEKKKTVKYGSVCVCECVEGGREGAGSAFEQNVICNECTSGFRFSLLNPSKHVVSVRFNK